MNFATHFSLPEESADMHFRWKCSKPSFDELLIECKSKKWKSEASQLVFFDDK
jgi:hypothetical protein